MFGDPLHSLYHNDEIIRILNEKIHHDKDHKCHGSV
jgi:hypothetical protein